MKKEVKKVKISELKPAEYNPRTISNDAKKALSSSLDKFGVVLPLIITEDYMIIGGHQRYAVAVEKGIEEVPAVVVSGLSEKEIKKLNITLNNPELQGEFNKEILSELFEDFDIRDDEDYETLRLEDIDIVQMPEFTPPEVGDFNNNNNGNFDFKGVDDEYEKSDGIKMIQILIPEEVRENFYSNIEYLKDHFGTTNITDTVVAAINYTYDSYN